MNTGKEYKTRQKERILQFIKDYKGSYFTASDIMTRMEKSGDKVGLTTIYRYLDKLTGESVLKKAIMDGSQSACYKYLGRKSGTLPFTLKCEKCGKILDIQCPELYKLYNHLSMEHQVTIDPGKTLFYGRCKRCNGKNEK